MNKSTKSDLVWKVTQLNREYTQKQAKVAVETVLNAIAGLIYVSDRLELKNFGVFYTEEGNVKFKPSKKSRI